jgi:hypothetical protein
MSNYFLNFHGPEVEPLCGKNRSLRKNGEPDGCDILAPDDSNGSAFDELRRLAGWNQTPADWRRMLCLEAEGCFLTLPGEQVVGTVGSWATAAKRSAA